VLLVDSNVWLALSILPHEHHTVCRDWLDSIPRGESLLFCRSTQQSFLRLLTNARVVSQYGQDPLTNFQAWREWDRLLGDGRIVFQAREPRGLDVYWREYAARDGASPKLWMDAYLAAFASSGGYQFVTTDTGFRQFEGLDLILLSDA